MTTNVSACVWCGAIVWRGAADGTWRDQAGRATCRDGKRRHLGHDHSGLNCEACYQTEGPQFREDR